METEVLTEIVELIGHLAWPVLILIILFITRKEIKRIFEALSERIRDKGADIAIGKEGLEIKTRIEATQAKMESLEIDQEQIKSLTLESIRKQPKQYSRKKSAGFADLEKIDPVLIRMANNYLEINYPDYKERVMAKDEAAREMANYIIKEGVSRDLLTAQHHEGLILGLASTIHAFPQSGDLERILRVADEVNRLHVKYRIVLAIGRLFERYFVSDKDITRIKHLFDFYRRDADPPLLKRINQTEQLIKLGDI